MTLLVFSAILLCFFIGIQYGRINYTPIKGISTNTENFFDRHNTAIIKWWAKHPRTKKQSQDLTADHQFINIEFKKYHKSK
jgi:hypothetical protein